MTNLVIVKSTEEETTIAYYSKCDKRDTWFSHRLERLADDIGYLLDEETNVDVTVTRNALKSIEEEIMDILVTASNIEAEILTFTFPTNLYKTVSESYDAGVSATYESDAIVSFQVLTMRKYVRKKHEGESNAPQIDAEYWRDVMSLTLKSAEAIKNRSKHADSLNSITSES